MEFLVIIYSPPLALAVETSNKRIVELLLENERVDVNKPEIFKYKIFEWNSKFQFSIIFQIILSI